MPLPQAPFLLFGVVLASFWRGRFCGCSSNSLCYSYLQLSEPSQGLPQFSIRGYLDDQPIACYDSLTKKMDPLVSWMEEKEKETFQVLEWVIGIDLEKLTKLDRQTGGLHTWQAMLGCELKEDGSKGGFLHYGYDGMDFISFDRETLRWVAAQPQAQKVKEEWEIHPGRSQRKKAYLEETCIEWLQRYQLCKKEALQRIGSSRHSLCYSSRKVSEPSQGLPLFLSLIHLDDQPVARNDGLTSHVVPLVPWMEEEEAKIFVAPEQSFRTRLELLSNLNPTTGGLHTWQVIWGCELREDGSKGGFLRYGYDGRDFLTFNKETLRWVTAQPQAQKVKEEWEEDPILSQKSKDFLEETCIAMMQKCLSYQKKSLNKTEPPVGKVTRKVVNVTLEVLICQAFGFYPKEIQATWREDGKVCKDKTLHRNVVPNVDGTYYLWLSIEIDPKERDRFQCHLEHKGLQGGLVLAFKEQTAIRWWIPVAIGAPTVLGAGIFFQNHSWWKCRKHPHLEATPFPDHVSLEMVPCLPSDGAEDEMQSQLMLQPEVTSEKKNPALQALPLLPP